MTARSWRDLAACLDVVSADYDPFFADSAELQAEAIAICATCPVRDDCLTFAVRTGQQYGIWGGQPERIVRRLIAADRAGRPHQRQAPASHPQASKTHCKHGHPLQRRQHLLQPR
jgi:WhiB family redox-sensing transcriptional regulator